MARLDVYRVSVDVYLLDIQADVLDHLATRVVVPLLPVGSVPAPVRKLHPVFVVQGEKLVMATHLVSAVPRSELRDAVASVVSKHEEVVGALDMLHLGF